MPRMPWHVGLLNPSSSELAIPAGKTVELKPKSFHIMLIKAANTCMAGQGVKGSLTFAKASAADVSFDIEAGKSDMGGMKMN